MWWTKWTTKRRAIAVVIKTYLVSYIVGLAKVRQVCTEMIWREMICLRALNW